jgi:hypothetical protein
MVQLRPQAHVDDSPAERVRMRFSAPAERAAWGFPVGPADVAPVPTVKPLPQCGWFPRSFSVR